jgi:hypothetical protein
MLSGCSVTRGVTIREASVCKAAQIVAVVVVIESFVVMELAYGEA